MSLCAPAPVPIITPRLYCAEESPSSAALRCHLTASVWSSRTPSPRSYILARLVCARTSPCSAAFRYHRYHFTASDLSSSTPFTILVCDHIGKRAPVEVTNRPTCAPSHATYTETRL